MLSPSKVATAQTYRSVKFETPPTVRYFESIPPARNSRPPRSRLAMSTKLYEMIQGSEITQAMLQEASVLFNNNYGVWGEQSTAKPGSPVRLSAARLRAQCLPSGATTVYVRVTVDNVLAGNAFASYWAVQDNIVCWVTQLVVDRKYRERGLAKALLAELKRDNVQIYGLMSSHPAACIAAVQTFTESRYIEDIKLDFIAKNADRVMQASPVGYVKSANLVGSLFHPESNSGEVCSVDTGFYVDHEEPLEALSFVKQNQTWPLGDLDEGHEFLVILEAKLKVRTSRSQSPVLIRLED